MMEDIGTIGEALNDKSKDFDFFRKVYDRVRTLYMRGVPGVDDDGMQKLEHIFQKEPIHDLSQAILGSSSQILSASKNIDFETKTADTTTKNERDMFQIVSYFAANTILNAYHHCRQENNKDKNSLDRLVFGEDSHNYLIDVVESMAMLEDVTSQNYTGEAIRHFVEKAIEQTRKLEREARVKGAMVKAEQYKQYNQQAFKNIEELWDTGQWKFASKCADDIFDLAEINLPHSTVYNYLRAYKNSKK